MKIASILPLSLEDHAALLPAIITMISRRASRQGPETVLVVGAGIVGLMTALDLVQAGYDVEVVEASHDPRTCPPWQSMGCTHGGQMRACSR
ncbi:FAD-dependent oxidoreductase [Roseibium sp.]|uniref:FAD-dependent oxidoreductase n=1 Tax=Roseibium sp. TaxID=1936156 RepID=UPI003A96C5CC